ncbi:hypothetical protein BS47DRAFT_1372350 [Hydnum rufescens UP504]|uniref:Vacuole protein n=1 Tax=Hydnum rufescens UP504 TaxID=1448309 RepID=A0A9P6DUG2_9AGAM|nr:hypothetical protein BS47DRAFT_1372350 [Hydnum rufescens UP504]
MCCNGTANWKREVVPDHKFDFVDTRDYHSNSWGIRLQYMWLYILLTKSLLVYLSDLYTAITMLSSSSWSNGIFARCTQLGLNNCVVVDFQIGKWIFVGCIILGYLLLIYEGWKAKKIIVSRDISYAFTNVMANNYYSLRSYDHFCFFCQIENSTKKKDDFAFFIFFTFKGWKSLIFSDGPRQAINALTLYSFWLVNQGSFQKMQVYFDAQILATKGLLISILFTTVVFFGSLLLLIIAALCYIPLLCYIQGNLKEYCCHKVDKRISELMKRKNRQRIAKQAQLAQKEARGDFSHLKNKKGELLRNPAPQPTLPQVSIDDDDQASLGPHRGAGGKAGYAPSHATSSAKDDPYYASSNYPDYPPSLHSALPEYPPPMPLYEQNPHHYGYPHLMGTQQGGKVDYEDSMYGGESGDPTGPDYAHVPRSGMITPARRIWHTLLLPPALRSDTRPLHNPSIHITNNYHQQQVLQQQHPQEQEQYLRQGSGNQDRGVYNGSVLATAANGHPGVHRRTRSNAAYPDYPPSPHQPQDQYQQYGRGEYGHNGGHDDYMHSHAM